MISRTSMKSQMKGNKMPIKVVPIKNKKKSKPNPKTLKKSIGKKFDDISSVTKGFRQATVKKSDRKKNLSEKIFGGGPEENYKLNMDKAAKKGNKDAMNIMKSNSPELMKRVMKKKSGGVIKAKGGLMAALSPAYALSKGGVGNLAQNFSPAYSIMKGKGPASQIVSALGGSSLAGNFAQRQRDKAKKARMEKAAGQTGSNRMALATPAAGLKGGGSVKKKKSIDGIATKGRTRG